MNKERITREQILNNIQEKYRHFFNIVVVDIDPDIYPLFEDFTAAANILCRFAHINKKIDIIFYTNDEPKVYTNPATLTIGKGQVESIHFYIGSMIFYNLNNVAAYQREVRITTYLEELVHVFMNVTDEVLVKEIVSSMYDGVTYDKNIDKYVFN